MELIAVNENKLKIILTPQDLEEFSIDADSLDYSRSETRLLLKCLLLRAKNEVGFISEGCRLLVQLYPSKQGGGEIYITKLGELCTCDDIDLYDSFEDEVFEYSSLSSTDTSCGMPDTLIRFDRAEAMIGYAKRLISAGYPAPSEAYFAKERSGSAFYLSVCGNAECASPSSLSPSELAGEYGQKITSEGKLRSVRADATPIFHELPEDAPSVLHLLSHL